MRSLRTAILCPGPSLPEFRGRDGYDLLIGVNRGALFAECDWVSVADVHTYGWLHSEGMSGVTGVITDSDFWRKIVNDHPSATDRAVLASQDIMLERGLMWEAYSFSVAVAGAWQLGSMHVDLYGADWTDAPDWDGFSHPEQHRGERRWAKERERFFRLKHYFELYGGTVRRVIEAHTLIDGRVATLSRADLVPVPIRLDVERMARRTRSNGMLPYRFSSNAA